VALLVLLGFMARQTARGFTSDAHQLDAMTQMRPRDPSGHLRNAWFAVRTGDVVTARRSLRNARRRAAHPHDGPRGPLDRGRGGRSGRVPRTMKTIRAVRIREPGDVDVLELGEVSLRDPGAGEVRVKVAAAGLNRADLMQRAGRYPAPPGVRPTFRAWSTRGVVEARGRRRCAAWRWATG
jgi:hypothetical protein